MLLRLPATWTKTKLRLPRAARLLVTCALAYAQHTTTAGVGRPTLAWVQSELKSMFPNAALSDSNKLSSVGLGLAYDGQRRFDKNYFDR